MPAPLIDGVILRCAAPLANHCKPLWLLAARSVETLSGMKSHCKAVPAWASVTLSVSSARAGTPAGPARHSAAPEGGSIGTVQASVLPAVGPEVPEASCGRQRTNEKPANILPGDTIYGHTTRAGFLQTLRGGPRRVHVVAVTLGGSLGLAFTLLGFSSL